MKKIVLLLTVIMLAVLPVLAEHKKILLGDGIYFYTDAVKPVKDSSGKIVPDVFKYIVEIDYKVNKMDE